MRIGWTLPLSSPRNKRQCRDRTRDQLSVDTEKFYITKSRVMNYRNFLEQKYGSGHDCGVVAFRADY